MIEINLIPGEQNKKKESRIKKPELPKFDINKPLLIRIGSGIIAALIAIHMTLFVLGSFSKGRYLAISKKNKEILPKKEEADTLKARSEDMGKKIKAINELMVNRFSWARKLNALSDSIIPGIWLSGLDYEESAGERPLKAVEKAVAGKNNVRIGKPVTESVILKYLIISGYATSKGEEGTALVGKFIKSLKDNPAFYSDIKEIELKSIRSDIVLGQEVMNFKISCLFRESK